MKSNTSLLQTVDVIQERYYGGFYSFGFRKMLLSQLVNELCNMLGFYGDHTQIETMDHQEYVYKLYLKYSQCTFEKGKRVVN